MELLYRTGGLKGPEIGRIFGINYGAVDSENTILWTIGDTEMRIALFIISCLVLTIIPSAGFSQTSSDYLILQDIGTYKLDRPEKIFPGEQPIGGSRTADGPGIIGPTGHFPDHADKTYEMMYIGGNGLPSPTVQVTKHSSSDSDKWLLHEVEDGYRAPDLLEANWSQGARVRDIDGNLIFGVRGSGYAWLSHNIVVNIEYADLAGTKPEPLEVIKAYLQKFPSSITFTEAEAKTRAHNEKWVKDEMERRLWLCDKWF